MGRHDRCDLSHACEASEPFGDCVVDLLPRTVDSTAQVDAHAPKTRRLVGPANAQQIVPDSAELALVGVVELACGEAVGVVLGDRSVEIGLLATGLRLELVEGMQRLVEVVRDVEHTKAVALIRLGQDRELLVEIEHEVGEAGEDPIRQLVAELPKRMGIEAG